MRMSVRVPLLVTGIAVATVLVLAAASAVRLADTIYIENREKLVALRAARAESVERYADDLSNRIRAIAYSDTTHDALRAFVTAANRIAYVGANFAARVREEYPVSGASGGPQHHSTAAADPMSLYRAAHERFHLWLSALIEGVAVRDVMMVSPSGLVVYSVRKGPAFGTNLNTGPWSSSGAGGAFRQAVFRGDEADVSYIDFSNHSWSPPDDPLAFGAAAVRDDSGRLLGAIVIAVGSDGFDAIMRGTAGLGDGGETYLVGHDNLMRSDSRFSKKRTVLSQLVDTTSADRAIAGETGFDIIRDYRGVEVMSAYQPITVLGNAWGLLAEVDTAQEYQFMYQVLGEFGLIALGVAGLATGAGVFAGRAITRPVVALRDAMLRYTRARQSADVPGAGRRDEIGDAARSFQDLTEEIDRYVSDLDEERQQVERTAASLAEEQERLRLTLDQMPGGLLILDPDLTVRLSSRQFARLYEIPAELLAEGARFEELLRFRAGRGDYGPGAVDDEVARRLDRYHGLVEEQAFEDTLPNGRTSAGIRSPTPDGGVVLVITDVTELKDARARAEAAAAAKAAFLATMSHEIRTPMNGVMSMAEMLDHTALDGEQRGMTRVIRQSAEALLTVINDILDFSKIEAGRLPIEHVPFALGELVEDVADLLAPRADERGLDLIVELAPDLPERVVGDPTRIRQILVNLGGNALKFTETGSVRIVARPAAPVADGPMRLIIEVVDSGIGMTPEQLQRLFEPFVQADTSTARRYGGTGLGLSICQRLAALMDGAIAVESTAGVGSTFRVELPLSVENPAPLTPAVAIDDAPVVLAGFREPAQTQLLAVLRAAGITAPREATLDSLPMPVAENADDGPPQVLLLDGRQPTALETVRRLTPSGPSTRLVLVAPRSLVSTLDEAARRGVFATLRLPVRRDDTWRIVAAALGRADLGDRGDGGEDGFAPPSVDEAREAGALILVAEDNPTNRLVIAKVLGRLGYAHEIAENGAEALALWRAGRYGLILTDFHMPEMDGFQLTAAVRADEAASGDGGRIPIVALTADALAGTEERCLEAGMDGYLTKPIRTHALTDMLARLLPHAADLRKPASAAALAPQSAPAIDRDVFDPDALADTFGAFDAEAFDFVSGFRDDAPARIAEIVDALAQGDASRARRDAYSLKGAARSVGANRLGQIAADVQDALDRDDANTAAFMAGLLTPALDELCLALESLPQRGDR